MAFELLKDNRLIAVTEEDRNNKRFLRVEDLNLPEQTVVRGWLDGSDCKDNEALSRGWLTYITIG